jgi:hypothetical protein
MLSPSVHNSTYCFLAVFPFLLFSVRKLRSQLLFQAIITKSTVFNNMNHNKQFHNQYIILLLHLPYYNMIKYFTFSIKIVALYMPGFSICRLLCWSACAALSYIVLYWSFFFFFFTYYLHHNTCFQVVWWIAWMCWAQILLSSNDLRAYCTY